ncbi:hypothetical protein SLS62_004914 [Diatrype stigma]|uniref:Uncharacterized protein n=1 Tax=Diatrype stigma TaxID=117547 RepID=A0AAN9UTM7_9PEZI
MPSIRVLAVVATVALTCPSATAVLLPLAEVPGALSVAFDSRQVSPEAGRCHADCGYTILDATLTDHCTNSTWTGLLDDCLDCALQYDIWKDYGDGVGKAAEGCGLPAEPEQPGTASSSSAAPSTTDTASSNTTSATSTEVPTATVTTTSDVSATPSTTGGAQPSNTVSRWEYERVIVDWTS